MSKRLQVLLPDAQYRAMAGFCKRQKITVAEWVRECIRRGFASIQPDSPEKKMAKILKYAKYRGPTADISELLSDIEKGRGDFKP